MNEMKRGKVVTGVFAVALIAGWAGSAEAQAPDAPEIAAGQSITIEFNRADAAVGGEAVLTAIGDQTLLALDLTGVPSGTEIAGFVLAGHCGEGGNVIAPLGTIEVSAEGSAEVRTELPFRLEEVAGDPIALEIRSTAAEASRSLACAENHGSDVAESSPEVGPSIGQAEPEPGARPSS